MDRRQYLLAVGAMGAISGCGEDNASRDAPGSEPETEPETETEDTSEDGTDETTETESDPTDNLRLEISDHSVAGGDQVSEIGDNLLIEVKLLLPVYDNIYDVILSISLVDQSGNEEWSETEEIGGASDENQETVEYSTEISTDEIAPSEYLVVATVEDYETEKSATAESDPLEIVDPLAEEKAAVEEHIETIRELIREAVDTFKSRGGGSLTGITAEDTDISMSGIIDPVIDTHSEIRSARDYELEEYESEIDRLDAEQELIRSLVHAQRHSFDIVEVFQTVLDAFSEESRANDELEDFDEEVADFHRRINRFSPGVADMVSPATDGENEAADYRSKVDQFNSEIDTFREIEELCEEAQEILLDLYHARRAFDQEDYTEAQLLADDVEFKFENFIEDVESLGRHPNTRDEFIAVLDELRLAARDLRRESIEAQDDSE